MLDRLRSALRRDTGGGGPVVVEVFTRDGCGLCEQVERLVAHEARGAHVRTVDIDEDPDLQRRYTDRVPVVAVNGQEVAEGRVPAGAVRRAVRSARLQAQ